MAGEVRLFCLLLVTLFWLLTRPLQQSATHHILAFVIDTVMSLGNTSETLKIIDASEIVADTVSYNSSTGANGDGKTLQKVSGLWIAAAPTPGAQNAGTSSSSSSSSSSAQNSSAVSSSNTQNIASGSVDYHYKNEQISAKAGRTKQLWRAQILF